MKARHPGKWFAAAMLLLSPLPLSAGSSDVTLAVFHDCDSGSPALAAMRAEATSLLRDAETNLVWVDASTTAVGEIAAERLVVVRLHGSCVYQRGTARALARKAYASVHQQRGVILPFIDVDCEKTISSVSRLLSHEDSGRSQILLGQALGRIVAHELYHILGQTSEHTFLGVAKAALSAEELVRYRLRFDSEAVRAIRIHQAPVADIATAAID